VTVRTRPDSTRKAVAATAAAAPATARAKAPTSTSAAAAGKAAGSAAVDQRWLADLTRSLTSVTRLAHSMRLYDAMGERAGLSIRPYLFGVLSRIHESQPVRVSEVADQMDYDRSTVSRHVAELVSLDCVERLTDPADGRVVILRLTEKGETAVLHVFQAWMDFLAQITSSWSVRDRDRFFELLTRFDESFGQHVAEL
jgi:DNA-binding MarR family transcriptional regulator